MVHSRDDLHSKFQVIRTKGSQVIAVGSWAEKSGNFVDSPCTSLSQMPKSANRKRSRDHVACRSRDHVACRSRDHGNAPVITGAKCLKII